jgi:RNA polymerase sigma-70 factor, ECF subfamily
MDGDDVLLVARTLEGDHDAFASIVDRYNRVLFGVAVRMLGDYEDARDATQNAFVKAFEHLEDFDPSRKFFSWIYRILVNECLNARRARRPEQPLDPQMPGGAGPLEAATASERHERIREALEQLPFDSRQVVVLRHFADLSYAEIGELLDIPEKTVKSRLFTARQRLATLLAALDSQP